MIKFKMTWLHCVGIFVIVVCGIAIPIFFDYEVGLILLLFHVIMTAGALFHYYLFAMHIFGHIWLEPRKWFSLIGWLIFWNTLTPIITLMLALT